MKKFNLLTVLLCCPVVIFGQLEVKTNGDTYIAKNIYLESTSNFLGTTSNVPITFKVNNSLAGFTGSSVNANVAFGYGALFNNSTGSNINTANGYYALYSNTYGSSNTANGYYALYSNMTGSGNTANGCYALRFNLSSNNTANGYYALYSNTTGSYNTAIGYQALYTNTTGSNNTAIGYNANVSLNNLTNATAIGYNATVDESDKIVIGNTSVAKIGGFKSWTTYPSDRQAKKNIRADVPGLAFINSLQPVTYNLDLDAIDNLLGIDNSRDTLTQELSQELIEINRKSREAKEKQLQTGFIAQDVEKAAKSIGYDFSGVDVPENGKGAYGLRYAEFVVPLVKAVQELSEQNDRLQEQVNELKAEIEDLKGNTPILGARPMQTTDIFTVESDQPAAALYQNAPNPFSQNTEIKYYLPASVNSAFLCIYDLNGKQLKQIRLSQRGNGSQIISGAEFSAGIYLYALIADGKEIDVKRMILTE